jgi:hypothetical protein
VSHYDLSIVVVVPLICPAAWIVERTRAHSLAMEGLSKLSESIAAPIHFAETKVSVRIDIVNQPDAIDGFSQIWRPSEYHRYTFLCFSADTSLDVDDAKFDLGPSRGTPTELEKMRRDLVYTSAIEDMGHWVFHLLTATIIALPASIRTASPTAIINRGIYHETLSTMMSCRHDAVELAKNQGWPPMRDLSVASAWEWFCQLPGLETAMSSGPVARAVASLTYIICGDSVVGDLGANLIWALLGLEAIYGRGNVGISEQLREKSEILLGKYDGIKKRIASAYDFRSRFVHGDLNIPFQYLQDVYDDRVVKLHLEDGESTFFMEALLISTLQELVLRNVHDIAFSYKISTGFQ